MPGRLICFVCGSAGAELSLRTKAHERAPYFPFLEHHDPPKGSRLPGAEGVVDSCRVCYAFLTQQWETYERSKTPAIKRLYWLKRADNGHFTGAEMRLQGEYIAQIMGLQYQPGIDGPNSPDASIRDGISPLQNRKDERGTPESVHRSLPSVSLEEHSNDTKFSARNKAHPHVSHSSRSHQSKSPGASQNSRHQVRSMHSEGVLDLTVKREERSTPTARNQVGPNEQTIICYTCSKPTDIRNCKCVNSCPQPTSEPYFPVLQKVAKPQGAIDMNHLGHVVVCSDCKTSLYQQWQAYELSGVRSEQRVYKLNSDISNYANFMSYGMERRMADSVAASESDHYICYLCGKNYHEDLIRMLYTMPPRDASIATIFFPFVRELRRPHGAQPLKADGTVMSCKNCYAELYQQWQIQEAQQIPVYHRKYSLSFLSQDGTERELARSRREEMQHSPGEVKAAESSAQPSDMSCPLNIQISEASTPLGRRNSSSSQSNQSSMGLLAIAPSGDKSMAANPASPCKLSSLLRKSIDGTGKTNPTVPHPLEQATSLPQKICFLCGEKCIMMKAHILYSYPVRHEAKVPNSQTVPFFPFLANHSPAPGAEPLSEDGTVVSCNICYHSLIKQWTEFEDSKSTTDNNRWLRKYALPDYVCYVCARYSPRENVKVLQFHKFPFLKEHKYPLESLILDGGSATVVCKACSASLNKQYSEYERLKVPMTLRKYNWVQSEEGNVEDSNESEYRGEDLHLASPVHISVDEDSQDGMEGLKMEVKTEPGEYSDHQGVSPSPTMNNGLYPSLMERMEAYLMSQFSTPGAVPPSLYPIHGLPQGSKPPPLNMINPATAGKVPRNTATVPPLNQGSPSNGVNSIGANAALNATRTSSFAAALRKLAHQAKDPEEGTPTGHNSQPGSSSTSPRAPTPKRGPPPLVYNSHSSSLTSPPVVTIAPTQSHTTNSTSAGKQSTERAHSAQSTSSTVYEPLSLKQDRERPQSSHSNREEDPNSAKDMSSSRSRMTPHSIHSSASPAIGRGEEGVSRGFQPYRAGEEFRHQLPPSAFGLDPTAAAAYSYPAFLPSHAFSHPAFRFDDPLLLERYRMMQQPYMPFPHPGMLPPPGVHPLLAQGRYPAELLHQQFPFASQSSRLPEHLAALSERQRIEEERLRELEREKDREREREREKEREKEREAILLREKERAKEREKEYDKERLREQFYSDRGRSDKRDRGGSNGVPEHGYLPRAEEPSVSRYGSITHGTAKDQLSSRDGKGADKLSHDSQVSNGHRRNSSTNVSDPSVQREDKYAHFMNSSHKASREQKSSKSMESHFFRPFDTNMIPNGYHGSQISDYDKYSNYKNSLDRNKPESVKTRHHSDHTDHSHSQKHSQNHHVDSKTRSDHSQDLKVSKHAHSSSSRKLSSSSQSRNGEHLVNKHHLNENHGKSSGMQSSDSKPFNLHNLPLASTLLFQQHDLRAERPRVVVSRLDLEEKRLREKHLNDPDYCESEDETSEESETARLLLITQGPPLPLETNREKMKFMKEIGLTSFKVKQELEFEKFRRRRRFHRERSVSPIEVESDSSSSHLDEPSLRISEGLCQEKDFPDKCSFLSSFNLETIESGRKKEMEKIRSVCEAERNRRLSLENNQGHGVKRKSDDNRGSSDAKRQARDGKSTQSKNVLFPSHKDYGVCREFVEEFHQSVLQSTRQSQKDLNHVQNTSHRQSMEADVSGRGVEGHRSSGSHDFVPKWPGVATILDSYQRYSAEQNMEHRMLTERCRNLQNQNLDLNKKAEVLSRKMAELLQCKKAMDEDKVKTQSAIDNVKLCLKDFKR